MAGGKEIRTKIKSVQNTRKITQGDGDGRGLQDAQGAGADARLAPVRATRCAASIGHLAQANPEYKHPFLVERDDGQARRLHRRHRPTRACAAASTPTCSARLLGEIREWQAQGVEVDVVAIGSKGLGFFSRLEVNMRRRSVTQLGDTPQLEQLIGAGQGACSTPTRDGQRRRGLPRLHRLRQHDEAGAGDRAAAAAAAVAQTQIDGSTTGTTSTSPMPQTVLDARADALRRGAGLPGGRREHGVRAVGAHGGDEGRVRQRRQA